jgi:hypothetical protein
MRTLIVVVCAALFLGAQPEPSPVPSEVAETPFPVVSIEPSVPPAVAVPAPGPIRTPNPYAILSKGRDVFHAHARPTFIVYTLERREWIDAFPDIDNSYTWRIWCRTKDDAAMARIFYRKRNRALEGLHFIKPTFNEAVDPGPPTGDIFPYAPPPAPKPLASDANSLRTIAVVAASADSDYRATYAGVDAGAYHLKLEAIRDRDRNRVREVWFDVVTLEVRRAILSDRLFLLREGIAINDKLDVQFAMYEGVPVLYRIRAEANIPPTLSRLARHEESDYFYDDIVFATTLPDWYFDPKTYREHFRDAPSR